MTSQAVEKKDNKEICSRHGVPLKIRLKDNILVPGCGEPSYELVCPLCKQEK